MWRLRIWRMISLVSLLFIIVLTTDDELTAEPDV
jgi:hypothetical protein